MSAVRGILGKKNMSVVLKYTLLSKMLHLHISAVFKVRTFRVGNNSALYANKYILAVSNIHSRINLNKHKFA